MTTAFVLSGGGARGDFELGAVKYLLSIQKEPAILAGTSVGALLALKLAEGHDAGDNSRGYPDLESLWLNLQTNSDMYVETEWLQQIDERIRDAITGRSRSLGITPPQDFGGEAGVFEPVLDFISRVAWAANNCGPILEALQKVSAAPSLYSLAPISALARQHHDPAKVAEWVSTKGGKLRLSVVSLESGLLRYVTETGTILERDGQTLVLGGHHPECDDEYTQVELARTAVEVAQARMDTAVTQAQRSAAARQIREAGERLEAAEAAVTTCLATAGTPEPVKVDLVTAAIASSTMPGIFRASNLDGETYVDGGVAEIVPVAVAVDLGADEIFAIVGSAPAVPRRTSFIGRSGIDAVSRSLVDISLNEISRNDVEIATRDDRVIVIQPTHDLHDALTIDPGLIRIGMAYGYMRAADAVDRTSSGTRRCGPRGRDRNQPSRNMANGMLRRRHPGPNTTMATCSNAQRFIDPRNPAHEVHAPTPPLGARATRRTAAAGLASVATPT